ncbi:hypothetical protein ACF09C_11320 [Streptomyces sp. NPDC014870]|uniref:hypothetical protein n=1 Tax=Streptomyces sp. NPDC014870 TaxID=3364925 RepID=UPI0036FA3E73
MATRVNSKALLWTGVGVGVVGLGALIAVALTDLGKADQIASVTGAVLAAVGIGLTLWGQFGRGAAAPQAPAPAPPPSVTASGAGSVAAGGSIGSVATGSGTTPAQAPAQAPAPAPAPNPAPSPTPPPAQGSVTASGDRSVAAGGDIGSVSTGDA